jgi:hypothetical protein
MSHIVVVPGLTNPNNRCRSKNQEYWFTFHQQNIGCCGRIRRWDSYNRGQINGWWSGGRIAIENVKQLWVGSWTGIRKWGWGGRGVVGIYFLIIECDDLSTTIQF